MEYQAKDFRHLIGLDGFSDDLLNTHFGLYEGYVKNTNNVTTLLGTLEKGTSQWAELQRRFGWEFNGMRLHELYFGNMTKDSTTPADDSALMQNMCEAYGTGEKCRDDFIAIGKMRGIGWVITAYDDTSGRLFNTWVDEHNTGHLASSAPIIVMDVFEHAYIKDYGANRAGYIDAFLAAIDWKEAERRFAAAQAAAKSSS